MKDPGRPSQNPVQQLVAIDKLVHEPVRLAILSALEKLGTADYVYLLTLTGLTRGNMSTHLGKLEKNGLIETERVIRGRKPRTLIWLTAEGQERISGYWSFMRAIQHRLQLWTEAEGSKSWTEHLYRVYGG